MKSPFYPAFPTVRFPRRLAWALVLFLPLALRAASTGLTFATPEAAVSALVTAVSTGNTNELQDIFGPGNAEIENPDHVQAASEFAEFSAALSLTNRLVPESEAKYVLEVGAKSWPFPIPIVKSGDRWFFDTAAGKDEILNRRIGENELATLDSVRAYVAAQREYAARDRNGDEVLAYAQKIISSPGRKDGLYWPPELDGETSPLGPLVAQAETEGYMPHASGSVPEPFHGYFFKILKRQGAAAPGGKYNYIINGHMIAGFALVAWPAVHGQSGIMTFIVNQQGRVYQKDLGPKTDKIAGSMKTYNPDSSWTVSAD